MAGGHGAGGEGLGGRKGQCNACWENSGVCVRVCVIWSLDCIVRSGSWEYGMFHFGTSHFQVKSVHMTTTNRQQH